MSAQNGASAMKRRGLPLVFVLLAVGALGEGYSGNQASLEPLIPVLQTKLSGWLHIWRRSVRRFTLARFTKEDETTIQPDIDRPYDPDAEEERLRRRLYIPSPDRTRFLDPFVGMELYEEDKHLKAAFDVDSGVALIDLRSKRYQRLLFCGTVCTFDEVAWIDNDAFVIAGSSEVFETDGTGGRYAARLWVFDLRGKRVASYRGPPIGEVAFGPVRDLLHESVRKRLPDIELD